jgi:hypothetical protein
MYEYEEWGFRILRYILVLSIMISTYYIGFHPSPGGQVSRCSPALRLSGRSGGSVSLSLARAQTHFLKQWHSRRRPAPAIILFSVRHHLSMPDADLRVLSQQLWGPPSQSASQTATADSQISAFKALRGCLNVEYRQRVLTAVYYHWTTLWSYLCPEFFQHQQSGQCIYITNMQNLNSALFYILDLEFACYFADWRIYIQNNMYNMQNNMQKNSALFRFCIFCILKYAQYAEYVK